MGCCFYLQQFTPGFRGDKNIWAVYNNGFLLKKYTLSLVNDHMLQAWHWKIISLSCLILCEYPLALWVLPYVDLMGHGHGNGTSLFLMGSTSSNGWVFFSSQSC